MRVLCDCVRRPITPPGTVWGTSLAHVLVRVWLWKKWAQKDSDRFNEQLADIMLPDRKLGRQGSYAAAKVQLDITESRIRGKGCPT